MKIRLATNPFIFRTKSPRVDLRKITLLQLPARTMEPSACEDLKAFERRLTEVVSSYRPSTLRWRIVLTVISICTAIGAWYWLRDPKTSVVPLTESLLIHPVFSCATLTLIILFLFGIHKLVIAPQIITSRMRLVLGDFNMSCDDTGKLILKPRPNNN